MLIVALILVGCTRGSATPTPTLPASTSTPIAVATPGLPPLSGDDRKIDPILLQVLQVYRQSGSAAAEQLARESQLLTEDNTVALTLILTDTNTGPIAAQVRALGGRVQHEVDNMIEIEVPLQVVVSYVNSENKNLLQDLAAFSTVREVRVTKPVRSYDLALPPNLPAAQSREALAGVISEGIKVTGADAWQAAGITGQGVKIGVIDIGFGGYEALLGQELPPAERVQFRSFARTSAIGTEVHGTAVSEIVHGMAPDASLWLVRIDSNASVDQAIRWLVDTVGVRLISMSIGRNGYDREDGSSITAKAVDYAFGKGVLCVVAAGNQADEHYAAPFADTDGNGYHEFAPGKEDLRVTAFSGTFQVILSWDAWSGPAINLDLELYAADGRLLRTSNIVQTTGGRSPVEDITVSAQPRQVFSIRIKGNAEPPPVQLQIFTPASTPEILTPAGSLATPGDAKLGFAVGATHWQTDKLEVYSSQGPTADGRRKPDITGPTVVSNATYAKQSPPSKFNGTSAATPHVTGAAALLLAASPTTTPEQLVQYLWAQAKDLGEPGPDNKTGYGRLQLGPPPGGQVPQPTPPRGTATRTVTPAGRLPTATPTTPTPVATPTAIPPTATLPPQPTVTGPVGPTFRDTFASAATGLPNGGEGRYAAGHYEITPNGADRATWSTYGPTYTDATVAVTVQFNGIDRDAAGLVFWHVSADDYHLFAITGDGYYQVARYVAGRWIALMPWTHSQAVTSEGPNALKVETRGAQIAIAVNGQALGTVSGAGAGGGRVGLLAATFGQPGFTARFSDFAVTPLP